MIRVFRNYNALCQGAAEYIIGIGKGCIAERGRFDLVLSGGRTPGGVYDKFVESTYSDREFWRGAHLFWGDERWVSLDDERSNYRMAKRSLIDKINIPADHVHPIPVDISSPEKAAEEYGAAFPDHPHLVLLGMGEDGHTASLFPGSAALDEKRNRFAVVLGSVEPKLRITMTPATIASARQILVIAAGKNKADALQGVFADEGNVYDTPARLVRDALWFVDEEAAEKI